MKTLLLIFFIVSAVISIGTLIFVGVDIVNEVKKKKKEQREQSDEKEEPAEVAAPVEIPDDSVPNAEAEINEHLVEHIDATEADELISDSVAMTAAKEESGAGVGQKMYVNIGDIDKSFDANETVTIDALKEKGLVAKSAGRIKILADGELTKPLTVKAEGFSIQSIKMIELTGGTVIILK